MRLYLSLVLVLLWAGVEEVVSQADGNPHNWDRTRRFVPEEIVAII